MSRPLKIRIWTEQAHTQLSSNKKRA